MTVMAGDAVIHSFSCSLTLWMSHLTIRPIKSDFANFEMVRYSGSFKFSAKNFKRVKSSVWKRTELISPIYHNVDGDFPASRKHVSSALQKPFKC